MSSEKVEVMIENHLQYKDQSTEGLGYNRVEPPYNHNYTPPIEPIILKKLGIAGNSAVPIITQTDKPVPIKIEKPILTQTKKTVPIRIEKPKQDVTTKPNESNASTTCAYTVLVEDWTEEEDSDSDTVNVFIKN